MKLKVVACLAFLLNTVLFATYYAVSKEALGRIDPIVFTFFEITSLVPAALCILVCSWRSITWAVVKRGVMLGSTLCLALFTISIALKYTSATSAAFFPALNGFLAALIAWFFFKHPITKATWAAGLLSIIGATLLIMNSPMGGVRGSLIAFLGGLFFTCYVFLANHEQKHETAHWPLFGAELLTMAAWACLVALLFGDWQAFHPTMPKDIWVVLYVAGACTFVPTLITVLLQKHISPFTVSFIYILEPILGAVIANFYLHELLPLYGYIGGALVVVGAFVQTWGSVERPIVIKQSIIDGRPLPSSFPECGCRILGMMKAGSPLLSMIVCRPSILSDMGMMLYPLLFLFGGSFLLVKLGGLPPASWQELYTLRTQLLSSPYMWQSATLRLLLAQAACWFVAWVSVALIGGIGIVRGLGTPIGTAVSRPRPQSIPSVGAAMNGYLYRDEFPSVVDVHQGASLGDAMHRSLQKDAFLDDTPITEDLPTLPEIQLWEEYPEPPIIVAPAYEISSIPVRKREERALSVSTEQRRKVRRLRLARVEML
ncbi:MAG: hypothetical protein NVSMB38_24720 [Ktedonobacteraceae bacterium]